METKRRVILDKWFSAFQLSIGLPNEPLTDHAAEYLEAAMQEYANLNSKPMIPSEMDMENKISDAKPFQKNETEDFIEGYSLGYHHCYDWINRIISLFN